MEIYADKPPEGLYKVNNKLHKVVEGLIIPVPKCEKNITTNNWFIRELHKKINANHCQFSFKQE